MSTKQYIPILPCGIIALLLITSLAVPNTSSADGFVFKAGLSGDQEVTSPAGGVQTDTTGRFKIQFNRILSEANYRLSVFDGVEITQAHLHCNVAGKNGPVVAFLAGPFDPPVDIDGLLANGTLVRADILPRTCDCLGVKRQVINIATLVSAIRAGCIYVNVHSVSYPGGEIRGQILKEIDDDES